MATGYLATPVKGRVGKARQVAPAKFEIPGPHSWEKIAKEVQSAFYKYCYSAYATVSVDPSTMRMFAELRHNTSHEVLATINIDEIED